MNAAGLLFLLLLFGLGCFFVVDVVLRLLCSRATPTSAVAVIGCLPCMLAVVVVVVVDAAAAAALSSCVLARRDCFHSRATAVQ
jgi:hypothetical protein